MSRLRADGLRVRREAVGRALTGETPVPHLPHSLTGETPVPHLPHSLTGETPVPHDGLSAVRAGHCGSVASNRRLFRTRSGRALPISRGREGESADEGPADAVSLIGQCYYRIAATRAGQNGVRRALRLLRAAGCMRDFQLPLDALHEDHPLVREMMCLWARIHWAGTDGMMPPRELLAVVRLAYGCPVEGDTVELGSWVGLTTCYLAAACRARGRGRVFAVDTFAGTKEGGETYASTAKYGGSTYETFGQNVRASGLADRVQAHVGLTTETVERHRGRPVRFLLIDADHSYEGVKADFECWSPLVAPGGFIVFHDYRIDDVRRFIDTRVVGAAGIEPVPGLVEPNVYAVTKTGTTDNRNVPARGRQSGGANRPISLRTG